MNAQGRLPQSRMDKLSALGFTWRKHAPTLQNDLDEQHLNQQQQQQVVAMPPQQVGMPAQPIMQPREEGVPLGMGIFIPDNSFRNV